MLWLGHWVGLMGEHLPNCSCLCSLCFIVLLYFHRSVSRGYFVSSGILSLLLCGFLTNPCFKIPCRMPNRNETWWRTADSSLIPRLVWVAAHSGDSQYFLSCWILCWCQPMLTLPSWICAVSGDIFDYCNLGMLLASAGWRPGMLMSRDADGNLPYPLDKEVSVLHCW